MYKSYKPTLMNFCPSISSQLLTGSCKGKQFSYERLEEHHEFIVPNDTIGC